ncbi:hypothetical protein B9Z65_8156 [Elsinoe australis]|uniref:Uncharacterized protein n=1 Tax=Elsinoe australis TaxID=40998 RepID=A0A2P7YW66_9PEZI|nr:hypothetical protein B9Z65_8156 [Elsinoe australis]
MDKLIGNSDHLNSGSLSTPARSKAEAILENGIRTAVNLLLGTKPENLPQQGWKEMETDTIALSQLRKCISAFAQSGIGETEEHMRAAVANMFIEAAKPFKIRDQEAFVRQYEKGYLWEDLDYLGSMMLRLKDQGESRASGERWKAMAGLGLEMVVTRIKVGRNEAEEKTEGASSAQSMAVPAP